MSRGKSEETTKRSNFINAAKDILATHRGAKLLSRIGSLNKEHLNLMFSKFEQAYTSMKDDITKLLKKG